MLAMGQELSNCFDDSLDRLRALRFKIGLR